VSSLLGFTPATKAVACTTCTTCVTDIQSCNFSNKIRSVVAHKKQGIYLVIVESIISNTSVLMAHLYNLNLENNMSFEVLIVVKESVLVSG